MKTSSTAIQKTLYLGIDVGGTKVLAALIEETGVILARQRVATPREGGSEAVLVTVEKAIEAVLLKGKRTREQLTAIGIAIPGVVDPDKALVVFTPNMELTGVAIGKHLEKYFGVPVAVGNDCNLGAMGEKWLGSARETDSAVAILVGTGIGGGLVQKGKLWRGAREAAMEIGHIVMQIDGPQCGCGNRGCLEALASRSAIERDLRAAIAAGRPTVLPEFCEGDLSVIRSGPIRKALAAGDELVTEVVRRAAEVLGYACLTVRHLIDPEVIVLGGGLVEACSTFMLPIVEKIVAADQLPGAREGGRVRLSALGDDAVVLGAVAMARQHVGRSPFKKRYHVQAKYPKIGRCTPGTIVVGDAAFDRDIYISAYGDVKKRKKAFVALAASTNPQVIDAEELEEVCRGAPEILFVGTGKDSNVVLSDDAQYFLAHRSIRYEILPTPKSIEAYNKAPQRKATLMMICRG